MKLIDKYQVIADDITADISVREEPSEFVYVYDLDIPKIKESTRAYLDSIKNKLISEIPMLSSDILDPKSFPKLKQKFLKYASELIHTEISHLRTADQWVIANRLVQEMIGLGDMEFLLADNNIEEICIVSSDQPIWIYHKTYGWLKTNLMVPSESKIIDYANLIGRRVGRSINVLNPLLDAHLITGDRVNATLYPVSMSGNTITIRKFARKP
jgi:flagellar protein FlaI